MAKEEEEIAPCLNPSVYRQMRRVNDFVLRFTEGKIRNECNALFWMEFN